MRIEFLRADIARITASRSGEFLEDSTHEEFNGPYYVEEHQRPVSLAFAKHGGEWRIEPVDGAACAVVIDENPFRLRVVRLKSGSETTLFQGTPEAGIRFSPGRAMAAFAIAENEHFIGWGADRHALDLRGQAMTFSTSELGKEGEGGGFPVPWMMSSRGYGLFLNNVDPTTRIDAGKARPDELVIDAADGGREGWNFDLYVVTGDSFSEQMQGYIALTGKPILAEKWFFGNLQSKCCDWQASDVVYIASRFHRMGLPLDAMILDLQWREMRPDMWNWTPAFKNESNTGTRNNLDWSPSMGDVSGMFRTLDEMGVKLGLHENSTSTYSDDAEGAGPYLAQSFPDVSDSAVVSRFWSMHEARIAEGADFWWQDQGERIDAVGTNGYPMKNLNGALWAKLVVEGMRREHHVSVPVISRSGPVGGHRYVSPWPGDVPAGLGYLGFDLDYIRNGGLAGFATIGADMGGFYHGSTPDEENEIRRICDMMLVFPVIRTHGAYYKLPWMFSAAAQPVYSQYLLLRYRLLPYIYSAAIEAHETGRPILAPLCFDYGDDETTYKRDFDFLLGRDLIVAPVIVPGDTREVYLPAGNWRDFWNDRPYKGGHTVTVDAPLESGRSLPMFVREGAIVPMIDTALTIPSELFDGYTLHLYPRTGGAEERVFQDRAHALDESSRIKVRVEDHADRIEVTIEGVNRIETLYLHGVGKPASVAIDGVQLPLGPVAAANGGWIYGRSDIPLQGDTIVLKVRWPESLVPGGRAIRCTIWK